MRLHGPRHACVHTRTRARTRAAACRYRSIGSGAGGTEFSAAVSAFGCGDVPMSNATYNSMTSRGLGVMHVPFLVGSVSVFQNVPGIGKVRRSCAHWGAPGSCGGQSLFRVGILERARHRFRECAHALCRTGSLGRFGASCVFFRVRSGQDEPGSARRGVRACTTGHSVVVGPPVPLVGPSRIGFCSACMHGGRDWPVLCCLCSVWGRPGCAGKVCKVCVCFLGCRWWGAAGRLVWHLKLGGWGGIVEARAHSSIVHSILCYCVIGVQCVRSECA